MTPSMRLSDIVRKWWLTQVREKRDDLTFQTIKGDLDEAFSLGHEFGLERAADVVDQCNRDGPYNAIIAGRLIRALKVERVQPVATRDEDFLSDGSK